MKKADLSTKRKKANPTDLSAQAHAQIMDYLRLADKSSNPALIDAAVQLAQQRQKAQQRAEAKISPGVAATLATLVACACAVGCWYALVHHQGSTGYTLVVILTSLALFLICIYALFSGHLSQMNFMVVFRWVADQLSRLNPFSARYRKSQTQPEIEEQSSQ